MFCRVWWLAMANQSGPIQEVSRLLDLVPYLSTHSYISIKELASEFGVSEKEIANELSSLSMCGLPGYTPYELIEIFFETGYVTINNHEVLDIPRALTPLELSSLLLGLELLRESAVEESPEVLSRIDALAIKLRELVGSSIKVESNPTTGHLALVESAIAQRRSLTITYNSPASDELSERVVDPYSLELSHNHYYLSAYCHRSNSARLFRIDRITKVELGEKVESSQSKRPSEDSTKETLSITVKSSRRAAVELFSLPSLPQNGKVDVDIYSRAWAEKAVLASAGSVEVTSPDDVRASIKASAEKILALYSS